MSAINRRLEAQRLVVPLVTAFQEVPEEARAEVRSTFMAITSDYGRRKGVARQPEEEEEPEAAL